MNSHALRSDWLNVHPRLYSFFTRCLLRRTHPVSVLYPIKAFFVFKCLFLMFLGTWYFIIVRPSGVEPETLTLRESCSTY